MAGKTTITTSLKNIVGKFMDPVRSLEKRLVELHEQRANIVDLPVPPQNVIAKFRARLEAINADLVKRIDSIMVGGEFVLINGNIKSKDFEDVLAFVFFAEPNLANKFEARLLAEYPQNWIDAAERVKRLANIEAEILAVNVELCSLYEELIVNDIDFNVQPLTDPKVFLGLS